VTPEGLRARGERFHEELGRESYVTGAGLAAEAHFEEIFERYADLAGDEAADAARAVPALHAWVVDNRVARRGAGLADLVEMSQKRKHRLALATQIHQRLAAAQRRARELETIKNQLLRFLHVGLSVGLLLGPSGPGYKQQAGLGADRLSVGGRFADTNNRGAFARIRQTERYRFNAGVPGFPFPRWMAAGIN
jgi:hypothetical protein